MPFPAPSTTKTRPLRRNCAEKSGTALLSNVAVTGRRSFSSLRRLACGRGHAFGVGETAVKRGAATTSSCGIFHNDSGNCFPIGRRRRTPRSRTSP